jgi:dipeptidyl aminopeptidase/acylaminoacyl peptidase
MDSCTGRTPFEHTVRGISSLSSARVRGVGLIAAGLAFAGLASTVLAAEPDRLVHRFLAIAVSPDGSAVASVEGDAPVSGFEPTVRDLVIRSSDGRTSVTVALPWGRVAECWPSSPVWSPDGKRLTFALRTPGTHARSLYTVDPDGGNLTCLLRFDGTISDLRYASDGRLAMLATAGANKEVGATQAGAAVTGNLGGAPPEQRIATLEDGRLNFISPPDLYVYEFDCLPDGGFIGTAAPGDGDNNWWVAKLYAFSGGHAKVIFTPPVSPDGRQVAFISGIMSDFGFTGGDVYTMALSGGPATDITPGLQASATAIGWSSDDRLLATLLAGDQTQIVEVGAQGTQKRLWSGTESLKGVDSGLWSGWPSPVTAFVHESFTAPPQIEVGPIGGWHELTHVNTGMTVPLESQSVTWKSDGAEVQGWLLKPEKSAGKLPLITVVHGGPAGAWEAHFNGPGLLRALLEHGYALFLPNPRGSFGQGEVFTAANVRDLGHGDLRDILAGIDAVERAAPIDDARLGIVGGSYGGFMTMWAVTQTNRFKAGVASAGISDWLSYYGENGIDQWMIPYFGASVYDDPEIYARSSPINFIRNVKTPIFSYVGADDIECPAPQTQEFEHALKAMSVPTSYAIYPGEGHWLRDPTHLADSEQRALAWFDRYLK